MCDQGQSTRAPAILVVDDDPEMLFLVRRILRGLNTDYEIVTCTRGDIALEQAGQRLIPLVITDYNLPGMNGLQLTAALKARAPSTRVILITSYAPPDMNRRAQDRGVDALLPKPFHPDALIQAVQAALT
jgi:CheY-like chemotaxis protein